MLCILSLDTLQGFILILHNERKQKIHENDKNDFVETLLVTGDIGTLNLTMIHIHTTSDPF